MALETRSFQLVEDEKIITVPALSPKWCEKRKFLHFLLPYPTTPLSIEDWSEMMSYIIDDLHWLLQLPCHRFWSQMIHDETINKFLTAFLQNAPRFFSAEYLALRNTSQWKLYKEAYNLVGLVFVRLATHKESKEDYITPSVFGELIYEHFIFDIPKLMDLCILYGPTNTALLSRMINNVFSNQPKYEFDLEEALKGLEQVFCRILGKLNLDDGQASSKEPSKPLSQNDLQDVVGYIVDIAATATYFIDIYPPAIPVYIRGDIPLRLVEFYEATIPFLSAEIERSTSSKEEMEKSLNLGRKFLLQLYHSLLQYTSIQPLLNASSGEILDKQNCVENWLEWMTSAVSEHHFIVDYNTIYPIQDDFDIISQIDLSVDTTRINYIENALKSYMIEFSVQRTTAPPDTKDKVNGYIDDATENVSEVLASLVSQVKDILPDLDDDMIKACLKFYECNAEAVIHAVLEGSLPSHLTDHKTTSSMASDIKPDMKETSLPSKDVEISKKARAKTVRLDEMNRILDDKHNLKSIILETVMEQRATEFQYDDEYDDTYDGYGVGYTEPDAQDDGTNSGRTFVVPRILQPKGEKEYEEEEEEKLLETPKDQFVPNPAELREKAEQRRQSKNIHGHGPNRNVVGNPRGQGQEKETTLARRHKAENKSKTANHNRRSLADRKRREF